MDAIGKYRLVRKLAEGGMAEVFLAQVEGPGGFLKSVVVKRVLPELSRDPSFTSMITSEAKLVAQLNHPNIVQVFDFGIHEGSCFLVMEYVDGFNLRALFKKAIALNQPIPFELAARMVASACEGLAYAHGFTEGGKPLSIIHRDISPENLLVGRNGVVKVADFGIARAAGQQRMTKTGTVRGKLVYMAPEQMQGEAVDCRVDVFALGLVLYELICGRRPFEAKTELEAMKAILSGTMIPAKKWRPDMPAQLQVIIDKAMARTAADRFKDCTQLQMALELFIGAQGVLANTQTVGKFVEKLAEPEQSGKGLTVLMPPREKQTVLVPVKRKKPWVGIAISAVALLALCVCILPTILRASGDYQKKSDAVVALLPPTPPPPPAETPEPLVPKKDAQLVEVSGELLSMNRDRDELWVRSNMTTTVRLGDEVIVVGQAREGSALREVYGSGSIMEMKGQLGRLDDGVQVPQGAELFAFLQPRIQADQAKVLKGRVIDRARGVVLYNETTFKWSACEVRLPFKKFFKFEDAIGAGKNDNIRHEHFQDDPREPDANMKVGWALVRCKEAVGYVWWGPKKTL